MERKWEPAKLCFIHERKREPSSALFTKKEGRCLHYPSLAYAFLKFAKNKTLKKRKKKKEEEEAYCFRKRVKKNETYNARWVLTLEPFLFPFSFSCSFPFPSLLKHESCDAGNIKEGFLSITIHD